MAEEFTESRTLRVEAQYNGPVGIAQGGYACGTVAGRIAGTAQVTLWRSIPLATDLRVSLQAGVASVYGADDDVLAEAMPESLMGEPPRPVSMAAAEEAMTRYPGRDFGGDELPCFVCSPYRTDGLGVFPSPLRGEKGLVASTWTPRPGIADGAGGIADEFVWAVLDCAGSWGAMVSHALEEAPLLGRMTAAVFDRPRVDENYVVVGGSARKEGRRMPAGAALFTERGSLVAYGELLCFAARAT